MAFLFFILTYPLIWILSRLPMRILYVISDFFYVLFYYVIGYRKKVVFNNIKLAFPEKSEQELTKISKKFFKHFTDLVFESVKSFSISEAEIKKRYVYKNIEVLRALEDKGKSIILMGSHYANWEWIIYLNEMIRFTPYGAYTRMQNPYFEKKIKSSRTKFGAIFVKTSETVRMMQTNKKNGKKAVYGLLSDQSPRLDKTHYWRSFLGVHVPVITGAEMLAKKFDFSIVNYNATKIKRGYYEIEFEVITENPTNFKDFD